MFPSPVRRGRRRRREVGRVREDKIRGGGKRVGEEVGGGGAFSWAPALFILVLQPVAKTVAHESKQIKREPLLQIRGTLD